MSQRYHKLKERGYALITAMAIGVVALSISSVVMLRMVNSTAQITQRERTDQALFLAESVANHLVDKIADITVQKELEFDGETKLGIYLSAQELVELLHGENNDFMDLDVNTNSDIAFSRPDNLPNGFSIQKYNVTQTAETFFNSLNSQTYHSKVFWERFRKTENQGNQTVGTIDALISSQTKIEETLNELHDNFYSIYHVQKGTQQADVQISVIPLATDIEGTHDADLHTEAKFSAHHDVLKIQIKTFMPSLANPMTQKTIDVIVNRPVTRGDPKPFPDKAILTGGLLDMQNGDTSAGPCAGQGGPSCIDEEVSGDVHSNGHLSINAPNGNVRGRATASGTLSAGGTDVPDSDYDPNNPDARDSSLNNSITQTIRDSENSRSGADEVPIPEIDSDTSEITEVCVIPGGMGPHRLSNCYVNGDLGSSNYEFEGTVHIRGNFSLGGMNTAGCKGTAPCRVVIDDKVQISGVPNYNYQSEQETLFVVKGQSVTMPDPPPGPGDSLETCAQISGTPDTTSVHGTLWYIDNPACQATMSGTYEFFGAIISKGSFRNNGNATTYGIQYATNMTVGQYFSKPSPPTKSDLFPKVVAWKNLR